MTKTSEREIFEWMFFTVTGELVGMMGTSHLTVYFLPSWEIDKAMLSIVIDCLEIVHSGANKNSLKSLKLICKLDNNRLGLVEWSLIRERWIVNWCSVDVLLVVWSFFFSWRFLYKTKKEGCETRGQGDINSNKEAYLTPSKFEFWGLISNFYGLTCWRVGIS